MPVSVSAGCRTSRRTTTSTRRRRARGASPRSDCLPLSPPLSCSSLVTAARLFRGSFPCFIQPLSLLSVYWVLALSPQFDAFQIMYDTDNLKCAPPRPLNSRNSIIPEDFPLAVPSLQTLNSLTRTPHFPRPLIPLTLPLVPPPPLSPPQLLLLLHNPADGDVRRAVPDGDAEPVRGAQSQRPPADAHHLQQLMPGAPPPPLAGWRAGAAAHSEQRRSF